MHYQCNKNHCTKQVLNMCAMNELLEWAKSRNLKGNDIYLNILTMYEYPHYLKS